MDAFMRQLTKNIKTELSGLLIEKYLYNFIRDFLYLPTTIIFDTPFDWGDIIIELPIVGSNYMILFDERKLKQHTQNPNLFIRLNKGEKYRYNFDILGDHTVLDYNSYIFKKLTKIYGWVSVNLKVIKYDTNLEQKIINNNGSFRCRYIINNMEKIDF